jgi:hypothetical protein
LPRWKDIGARGMREEDITKVRWQKANQSTQRSIENFKSCLRQAPRCAQTSMKWLRPANYQPGGGCPCFIIIVVAQNQQPNPVNAINRAMMKPMRYCIIFALFQCGGLTAVAQPEYECRIPPCGQPNGQSADR